MKKHYIKDLDLTNVKEGDFLYLEMPPFCTGEYKTIIKKDDEGFYVESEHLKGCIDYRLTPYWSEEYQ